MFTNRVRIAAAALAFALLAAASAAAQQAQPTPAPADNFVDHKQFQTMLFNVRHRDPDAIVPVLRLLTSGHKGAAVSANRTFNVITVRDFAENVASIGDAIKRLDTPEGERPEVELRMYVLIASNSGGAAQSQFPAELKEVVGQLQSTLNFRNYQLLTTLMQRTKERSGNISFYINGEGSAQAAPDSPNPVNYRYAYQAHSLSVTPSASGAATVQIGGFQFSLDGGEAGGRAFVRSDVGLREGERVVVGTAGLRDKSLIVVLTARLIK